MSKFQNKILLLKKVMAKIVSSSPHLRAISQPIIKIFQPFNFWGGEEGYIFIFVMFKYIFFPRIVRMRENYVRFLHTKLSIDFNDNSDNGRFQQDILQLREMRICVRVNDMCWFWICHWLCEILPCFSMTGHNIIIFYTKLERHSPISKRGSDGFPDLFLVTNMQ